MYRDFWFDSGKAEIHHLDASKLSEIAAYMKDNPSLELGIDGSAELQNQGSFDRGLCDRRVKVIRDALVKAGVPADRIKVGAFGDAELRRDQRVDVLIATAQ